MLDRFPYGKAPFVLLVVAVVSSLTFAATRQNQRRADLVLAVFAAQHYHAYVAALPKFERQHGVKVDVQRIDFQSLEARLQSAIVSNTEIPDLTEISEGTLGFFTRGPVQDFGFLDLTDRVREEGLDHRVVEARYAPWTARGRVYALPHDVHPVMLAYRRDLVEQLGIDVSTLETWDDFIRVGRQITRDADQDGSIDHYMLDLPKNGQWGLQLLLRQRGVDLFNARGEVAFNTALGVDTLLWYLQQTRGPNQISFEAGEGQPLAQALRDGLVLFVLTPDWRSYQIQIDAPMLAGKMALMPLPAFEKGGRRTSTWGMTGLTISKATKHPELAWELAKFLYFNREDLGARFAVTNILPSLKEAWDLPEFQQPNAYYSGQKVGAEYARLAPQVPPIFSSAVYKQGQSKLDQALTRCAIYYDEHGEQGLRQKVAEELERAATYLKMWSDRNAALARGDAAEGEE
ncbi:MAG TPA: extracellular solute-binding protein [Polyangiaceae bacterium]|nr:extracellular solute-binding protein [Polyangiaceae bacterium]